jgi:hypothetical protein
MSAYAVYAEFSIVSLTFFIYHYHLSLWIL